MGAVIVLVWVACAALGFVVGRTKERGTLGLLLGLLLGIIGLIIIAVIPAKKSPLATPATQFAYPPTLGQSPWPTSSAPQLPAWRPDPSGRYQYRWWDGRSFTNQVATNGVSSTDPISV
jgi:hypothetical protein